MTSILKLPKALQNRVFSLQDAKKCGLSPYQLGLMMGNGFIERLGQGIYRENTGDISNEEVFTMATKWLGYPSAICLISALSFYNLTDEIPKRIWVMVEHDKKSNHRELRLVRLRRPWWELGINKNKYFWITGVARTIVDVFAHPQLVGTHIAVQALKKAVGEKKTTPKEIFDISVNLGINHRITPYLEMVS